MPRDSKAFEKAMKLAVVSGLKCLMGPALVAAAHRRPDRNALAGAAMAEMVVDKLPITPMRSTLPLLLPRAVAGYWVTKELMEREGIDDPLAAPIGAAVAAGTATLAPLIRLGLGRVLGLSDAVVGLAEDYLALRLGGHALGLSMNDMKHIATESLEDMKNRVLPVVEHARERIAARSSDEITPLGSTVD
jgi:hypothetical protein